MSAHTAGTTSREPTGMKTPSSRSKPRTVFRRLVRSWTQAERKRRNEVSVCCATVLTGTARMSSLRLASRMPLASVRSVLLRQT